MNQDIQERITAQVSKIGDLSEQESKIASQMNHHSSQVTVLFKKREQARRDVQKARETLASLHIEAGAFRLIIPEKKSQCSCKKVSVQIGYFDKESGVEVRKSWFALAFETPRGLIDLLATDSQMSPFSREDDVILHDRLYRFIDGEWTIVPFDMEIEQ